MKKLINKIGTSEVIVMILTACLGIRWIPVAGSMGPSAILFWIAGALLFFIPLSLIVMELTHHYNKDGGVYLWVKQSLGDRFGFYTAWLYWINNFFFYPGLLVFMVANIAYLFGDKTLAENHLFVISVVIICLWSAIFINIKGIKWIANIASYACVLNIFLAMFIILSGLIYLIFFHKSATSFQIYHFIPNQTTWKNISNLTLLMFALSGIELIPTMAGSIQNSRVTLMRSIVISGLIILSVYMLGTLTINIIMSPSELNNTTGLMETFLVISTKLHIGWITMLLILLLFLVELGALLIWLIAPTVMLFECVESTIFPRWMQELNKHHVPANALILIGCIVTCIIMLIQYLPTVNSIFTTLVLMGTIVYFMPYLFLIVGYIKLRAKNALPEPIMSKSLAYCCGMLLFIAVCTGIILSFFPSADIQTRQHLIVYEIELIGGPLLFMALGYFMYARSVRRPATYSRDR